MEISRALVCLVLFLAALASTAIMDVSLFIAFITVVILAVFALKFVDVGQRCTECSTPSMTTKPSSATAATPASASRPMHEVEEQDEEDEEEHEDDNHQQEDDEQEDNEEESWEVANNNDNNQYNLLDIPLLKEERLSLHPASMSLPSSNAFSSAQTTPRTTSTPSQMTMDPIPYRMKTVMALPKGGNFASSTMRRVDPDKRQLTDLSDERSNFIDLAPKQRAPLMNSKVLHPKHTTRFTDYNAMRTRRMFKNDPTAQETMDANNAIRKHINDKAKALGFREDPSSTILWTKDRQADYDHSLRVQMQRAGFFGPRIHKGG